MIPIEIHALLPSPGGSPAAEARDCLDRLESTLARSGRSDRHVLSLTFFTDTTRPEAHRGRREEILAVVREAFGPASPPASVVAQAPERRRRVALEATVLALRAGDAEVRRRTVGETAYSEVTGGGVRQIHGAGIGGDVDGKDLAGGAEASFRRMEEILRREKMDFGHVVRQWNYIEGVTGVGSCGRPECQRYQIFNDVRRRAYSGSRFAAGYPAATGIGQAAGGVLLEFIALAAPREVRVRPVSNPRQIDAHRYSAEVLVGEPLEEKSAKAAPMFERAKLVARGPERTVFVSGTAAVVGEESVAPGDVAAQTRTTLENIGLLTGGAPLTGLRAYVKRDADIPAVRRILETAYGPIPALYVRADVCREELLVEIEGTATARAPDPRGRRAATAAG